MRLILSHEVTFAVYCVIKTEKIKQPPLMVRTRNYERFKYYDAFIHDLHNSFTFGNVYNCTDVDTAWDLFKYEYINICHNHAPIQTYWVKKHPNPWFHESIQDIIYKRNFFHKKAINNKTSNDWSLYKTLRNRVTSMIREAKKSYYKSEIDNNKYNP